MSHIPLNAVLGEQLIDSRQAALMFNLPTYWLSQAKERQQRRIPHNNVQTALLSCCRFNFLTCICSSNIDG